MSEWWLNACSDWIQNWGDFCINEKLCCDVMFSNIIWNNDSYGVPYTNHSEPLIWDSAEASVQTFSLDKSHRDYHGVPLGPLAISSLAFLFKNKNARFSHENSKCVWNLDLFKIARLEIARARCEGARFLPRCRTLAISSLAFFKTSKFQTRLRFSCETLAFLFLNKKARLDIASTEHHRLYYLLALR